MKEISRTINRINMDSEKVFERVAISIASLNRSEVERRIKNFKGSFKFDFTDEYLAGLTIDRLRHILFAAISTKLKRRVAG
jgi:hypothetical protein